MEICQQVLITWEEQCTLAEIQLQRFLGVTAYPKTDKLHLEGFTHFEKHIWTRWATSQSAQRQTRDWVQAPVRGDPQGFPRFASSPSLDLLRMGKLKDYCKRVPAKTSRTKWDKIPRRGLHIHTAKGVWFWLMVRCVEQCWCRRQEQRLGVEGCRKRHSFSSSFPAGSTTQSTTCLL